MMAPASTRELLAALRSTDHKYLAVRPADATYAEAPAMLIDDRTANDLSYAMTGAGAEWPDVTHWVLIGADELLVRRGAEWPPRMRALRQPTILAEFETTDG